MLERPICIAIAGGSGAGKSTVSHALLKKYEHKIVLLQLDGYFRHESFVPEMHGMKNWDHPHALDFDRLYNDLQLLHNGQEAHLPIKDETKKSGGKKLQKRTIKKVAPKEIILIEGFLCLYDERIRTMYEKILWLDIDADVRWERRVHFKYDEYKNKILDPMFEEFVLPGKDYATDVIDVTELQRYEVLHVAEEKLASFLL